MAASSWIWKGSARDTCKFLSHRPFRGRSVAVWALNRLAALAFLDKGLPALRCESQIDCGGENIPPTVPVLMNPRQGVQQPAVLSRRFDLQPIQHAKAHGAMDGMDRPEQRQVIVVVLGGHRLELGAQDLDTTLIGQYLTDTASQIRIVSVAAGVMEHLTEHADQGLFHLPVLLS